MKLSKSTIKMLVIAMALILVGSIFACVFNTSMGSVKVSRISFETAKGTMSGLLYMPKDASASNPKPTVVVTHGYLNSAEMQDANAIELSRRGYVVLAVDMYDHGHSKVNAENYGGTDFFGLWSTFWINSMNDAVDYIYDQPYVLKDANGNGMIGVTGHSMGGFSSTVALAMDEAKYAATGVRKIACGLTEGSDFSYSGFVGVNAEAAATAGGGRYMGKVAAQYDEFFFNNPADPAGTVRHKDYVSTPDGMTWLEQEAPQANTWYATSDGGQRIIYEPAQTHPWNHFSKETTAYALNFYNTAFAGCSSGIKQMSDTNQIWMFKEFAECIALVGFLMLLIPLVEVVISLPFFNKAKTALAAPAPAAKNPGEKFGKFATIVGLMLIPAIIFNDTFDFDPSSSAVNGVYAAGVIFAIAGVVGIILSLKAAENKKGYLIGSIIVTVAALCLAYTAKVPFYEDLTKWTAPSVNSTASWTLICALISILSTAIIYVGSKAAKGTKLDAYGICLDPMVICASVCTAAVVTAAAYIVLFLMDLLFKADFRIWVFAFKTWDFNIMPAVLKYLPTFLLFYFISTVSIFANTNTEGLQGVKGYLVAIAINAGGAILWLVRQYITLFSTGVAAHPGAALSGIVLVAIACMLTAAACISRALYKRTGNVWIPAVLNALLVTISTLANTTIYFK